MEVVSIKTQKIKPYQWGLFKVLDKYIKFPGDQSIIVITSKIVSICEGRVVEIDGTDKNELIKQEAKYFLPPESNKYNFTLTIKGNILLPSAGIDESNGSGYYILWPKDPQKTANEVRKYLRDKFSIKKLGVIITDSKTTPLRRGTTGVAIAYSGFFSLNDYIGRPDIFGRKFKVQKANVLDSLAASAVLIMGEGCEQTPLAVIRDIPFVKFKDKNPSTKELNNFHISIKEDIYGSLLNAVKWKKGKGK